MVDAISYLISLLLEGPALNFSRLWFTRRVANYGDENMSRQEDYHSNIA
ncbi:hypothetical protein DSUL_140001 [Desulfovibrionales bacterium]